MRKSSPSLLALAAATLLASAGFAQQVADVRRASPVRNAGVYHVASGTWLRGATTALSADVIYNNSASSGFYGNMGASMEWTDVGALPGLSHGGCADSYHVDGFQIGYCTQEGPAGTILEFAFYDLLGACTDPSIHSAVGSYITRGPGSSLLGVSACWIVTYDLQGTTLEFDILADGDGVYDGSLALDTFGFRYCQELTPGASGGPLLQGDPNNVPFGDGTYYQNPGSSGSGLGQQDQFWLFDGWGVTSAGCYWFGGYGPGTPWTGWHLKLYADLGPDCSLECETFCTSNLNSTGAAALITSTDSCDLDGDGVIAMQASPVPNQPGIFFHGTTELDVPFGCGHLCTAGGISRGGVVFASGNVASYAFDAGAVGIQPGDGNFQYWFRDSEFVGACASVFNTSNAMRY